MRTFDRGSIVPDLRDKHHLQLELGLGLGFKVLQQRVKTAVNR